MVVSYTRTNARERVAAELVSLPTTGVDQAFNAPASGNASYFAFAAALLMLTSMLGVAFEKNLVATLTQQGWGRTLQGIGAALTQLNCGVGGLVIDKGIDNTLRIGGISNTAQDLTPLGMSYPENLWNPELLQSALDGAARVDCAQSARVADATGHYTGLLGFNGEDAGIGTFTRLAFAVFGPNLPALTYGYFAIALISLVLFAASHYSHPGAMVAAGLLTVALYLVVCSSLLNFAVPGGVVAIPGVDLKDPRFLGTLAALPLLHIIVTWIRPPYRLAVRDYLVLGAQVVILTFASHIRFSVMWSFLVLPLLWLFFGKSRQRTRDAARPSQWCLSRSRVVLITVCLTPCIAQAAVSWSYHPFYEADGDLGRHTFWDGVLQSLEYNPAWTAKYGAEVNWATGDELPLTAARLAIARLPAGQQQPYLTADGNPTRIAYEEASKTLFLDILWHDPGFVLGTFLSIKPLRVLRSELIMYRSLFVGLSGWHLVLPLVTLALLGWLAAREMVGFLAAISTAAVLCALLALLPNWLVLVNEFVMFDNFTWGLFFICSLPIVAVAALGRLAQGHCNTWFQTVRTDGALASNPDDTVPGTDGD